MRVWHVVSKTETSLELGPIDDDTRAVAFSPAGDLLIAGGDDGIIRAWSVRGGAVDPRSMRILAQHRGAIRALVIDAAAGVADVSWRDEHAERIDLASPHAAHARALRADEGAPWLSLAGASPLRIAAHGDVLSVSVAAPRSMDALHAAIADAIGVHAAP